MFLLFLCFLSVFSAVKAVPENAHVVEKDPVCGYKCKFAIGTVVAVGAFGVTNKLTKGKFFRKLWKLKPLEAIGFGKTKTKLALK